MYVIIYIHTHNNNNIHTLYYTVYILNMHVTKFLMDGQLCQGCPLSTVIVTGFVLFALQVWGILYEREYYIISKYAFKMICLKGSCCSTNSS